MEALVVLSMNKVKWWPASRDGKIALALCTVAVVYGILILSALSALRQFFGVFIDGRVVVSFEIILSIVAFYFSFRAIFRNKDRAVLTIVPFCVLCLVGGFWLLFAFGELLFPH
jgi:hypothetical protein